MPVYFYFIFGGFLILLFFLGKIASSKSKHKEPRVPITERININGYLLKEYSETLISYGQNEAENILDAPYEDVMFEEPMKMLSNVYEGLKTNEGYDFTNSAAKGIALLLDSDLKEYALYRSGDFYFSRYAIFIKIRYGQYADSYEYIKCPYRAFIKGHITFEEQSLGDNIIVRFDDLTKYESTNTLASKSFHQSFSLSEANNQNSFEILQSILEIESLNLPGLFSDLKRDLCESYKRDLENEIALLNAIWQDDSGNLKIAPNIYTNLFEDNKEVISTEFTEKISDLIKVKSFINENHQLIKDTLSLLLESKSLNEIVKTNKTLIKNAQFHEYIVAVGTEFLLALLENDNIKYHEIREMFDRNNIFENNWQKEMRNQMSNVNLNLLDISDQINGLRSDIDRFENNLIAEMQTLQLVSAQGFAAIGSKLNALESGIDDVGRKIDVGNSIASVNTYQNYQLKKALT